MAARHISTHEKRRHASNPQTATAPAGLISKPGPWAFSELLVKPVRTTQSPLVPSRGRRLSFVAGVNQSLRSRLPAGLGSRYIGTAAEEGRAIESAQIAHSIEMSTDETLRYQALPARTSLASKRSSTGTRTWRTLQPHWNSRSASSLASDRKSADSR